MRKLLLGLIGLLFAVPAVAATLPAGYTELEYIESTATQYIDTGLYGNLNTEAEIDVHLNETTSESNNRIFGNFTDTAKAITINGANAAITFSRFGDKSQQATIYSSERSVYKINKTNLTRNGVVLTTFDTTTPFTTEGTLLVGSSTSTGGGVVGKLYSAIIRENGNTIMRLVPAKNSSNVVGMYDTVSGTFFTNKGTGTFVAGPVVPDQQIRIATTAYNSARFSPVVTELNTTIATIRDVVTNTINQTKAIADLQATKQTRPDEQCPAGKKCLLVEDNDGTPHWYEIIESANRLPSGYTALEYIESRGAQYIDTGYKPNQDSSVEVVYMYTGTSSDNEIVLGTTVSPLADNANNGLVFLLRPNRVGFGNGASTTVNLGGAEGNVANTKYTLRYDKRVFNLDGATIAILPASTWSAPYNLYLFARNNAGTSAAFPMVGRIYSYKAWDNNTLVQHFIPVKYVSGNTTVYGMYDLMDNNPATAFHTNAGTGTFVAGPEI